MSLPTSLIYILYSCLRYNMKVVHYWQSDTVSLQIHLSCQETKFAE